MEVKKIFQEIKSINKNSLWEDQAEIEFLDEENPFLLKAIIKPKYGYFKDTTVNFKLELPKEKNLKPKVTCLDQIYHPNMSFDGTICFSMFSDRWSDGYNIEHYINGMVNISIQCLTYSSYGYYPIQIQNHL